MLRHYFATACALAVTAGCQTVDLTDKSVQANCAIAATDYKLLRFWNDRTNDKKYPQIITMLEKKYATAPKVDGRSAVVSAQSYVRSNASKSPQMIESEIKTACKQ